MLKVVGANVIQMRISSYILGSICVLAIMSLFLAEMERIEKDGNYAATVYWTNKTGFRIEFWGQGNDLEDIPKGAARAYYRADIALTGWSQLEIETESSNPDWVQAYSAGLLEGALTWQLIYWHWSNTIEYQCDKDPDGCELLRKTLQDSISNVRQKANKLDQKDPFWHHVHLFYSHIDGISTGWNYGVERSRNELEIDRVDFLWMNSISEIPQIAKVLNITLEYENDDKPGMASAFVQLVKENKNNKNQEKLYMAHNTAGSYNSMLRLIKRYKLNYHLTSDPKSPLMPGTSSVFTGYPAAVSSHDEMYIVTGSDNSSHKLAIVGTTFNNFNDDLYKELDISDKVPIGPRVSAANHLATCGRTWSQILAHSNSGSAFKQWVVADFSKLSSVATSTNNQNSSMNSTDDIVKIIISELDSEEQDVNHTVVHTFHRDQEALFQTGLLWVIEQIPGLTHAVDETRSLHSRGYWASYGIPYIQDIAELTATYKMEEKFGEQFSVHGSPRALLFDYSSKKTPSIDSLITLMRSNHFSDNIFNESNINSTDEHDQLSKSTLESNDNNETLLNSELTQSLKNNITEESLSLIKSLVNSHSLHGVGVRGDIAGTIDDDSVPVGVIDTKILCGTANEIDTFLAVAGPVFSSRYRIKVTKFNNSSKLLNKGNVAMSLINNKEVIENELLKSLGNSFPMEYQNTDIEKGTTEEEDSSTLITPFKWSSSLFTDVPHIGHPDEWNFEPFDPKWVW